MEDDSWFLERSIELARRSAGDGGGPFGAVVVKQGLILAEGTNLVTSTADPTAHAEVVAIRKACLETSDHRLLGCTIYASCEPCPMCLGAIHWSRIDRIVFAATRHDAADAGFDDALLYQELTLPPAERVVSTHQLPTERRLAPFEIWRQNTERVPY